jgi:Transposase DDE domain/Transposase domain (DUF772)
VLVSGVAGLRSPVEGILRRLVVKHLYGWSYEATERWVSDSLVLRQFCRVYTASVPDDTTLPGAKSAKRIAHEQQRWFRRGHNWRSGIEGRMSGLQRRQKLDRCRYHGTAGMERWVGWGVIAHNLRVIAQATAA